MKRIYDFIGGRSMSFAWTCLGMGFWLAIKGQLSGEFTALVALLSGIVVGRAIGQDFAGNRPPAAT